VRRFKYIPVTPKQLSSVLPSVRKIIVSENGSVSLEKYASMQDSSFSFPIPCDNSKLIKETPIVKSI
jgi:hypothetical protein